MKTRQELILDFMLAIASNSEYCNMFPIGENAPDIRDLNDAQIIYVIAESLTNEYLENV